MRQQSGDELVRRVVPQIASGAWELVDCRRTALVKQRRKRLLYLEVGYHVNGDPKITEAWVAKVYGADRGGHGFQALQLLWDEGFRPPSELCVPRPYGYVGRLGTLVQGFVSGASWADHLHGDSAALRAACEGAADWLAALHGSALRPAASPSLSERPAPHLLGAELAAEFPLHASSVRGLAEEVADRLVDSPGTAVACHGDYHPKNVYTSAGTTTVIDFDTFGPAEPAFDVGYAIAQLLIMSHLRCGGSFARGAQAAAWFWARYCETQSAETRRVAVQMARALLQSLHYELCTLRNGRVELLDVWCTLGERALAIDDLEGLLADLAGGC